MLLRLRDRVQACGAWALMLCMFENGTPGAGHPLRATASQISLYYAPLFAWQCLGAVLPWSGADRL